MVPESPPFNTGVKGPSTAAPWPDIRLMQKEYVRLILPWLTRATMTWKRKLVVLNHHLFFDPKKMLHAIET
jgi:hypothetical protein